MKTSLGIAGGLIAMLVMSVTAAERGADQSLKIRATIELKDGSRLVGEPLEKSLPLTLDFMKASIPLDRIRCCEVRHKGDQVVVSLQNGDRLTGSLGLEKFKLETALGKLAPAVAQIDRMTFATWREGDMPAGEGSLFFGGVNWHAWRTQFEIQGDRLVSLPKARPGFNYGHSGNGRGPILMSNIGNSDWKNYSVAFEFCVTGVDPSFNPYGLGSDYHDGLIWFHVVDAKESQNECGTSAYGFSVDGDGAWNLFCTYNEYCATPIGYGNPRNDGRRTLASGRGLKVDRVHGNKYRIDVRGQHIKIWVDGEQIVDVTDKQMDETIGGKRLDHGGVGFQWGYDAMGWIRNFSATAL